MLRFRAVRKDTNEVAFAPNFYVSADNVPYLVMEGPLSENSLVPVFEHTVCERLFINDMTLEKVWEDDVLIDVRSKDVFTVFYDYEDLCYKTRDLNDIDKNLVDSDDNCFWVDLGWIEDFLVAGLAKSWQSIEPERKKVIYRYMSDRKIDKTYLKKLDEYGKDHN